MLLKLKVPVTMETSILVTTLWDKHYPSLYPDLSWPTVTGHQGVARSDTQTVWFG